MSMHMSIHMSMRMSILTGAHTECVSDCRSALVLEPRYTKAERVLLNISEYADGECRGTCVDLNEPTRTPRRDLSFCCARIHRSPQRSPSACSERAIRARAHIRLAKALCECGEIADAVSHLTRAAHVRASAHPCMCARARARTCVSVHGLCWFVFGWYGGSRKKESVGLCLVGMADRMAGSLPRHRSHESAVRWEGERAAGLQKDGR